VGLPLVRALAELADGDRAGGGAGEGAGRAALGSLPRISAAMERGGLSYSKARASQVEGLVRAWRRVDRQEEAEEERLRHERRYVSLYPDEDGSWTLRGRLDPEVGALLEKALEWASEQVHGKRPPSETSVGQRRADALGLVAVQALGDVSAEMPSTPRRAVAKQADRFQVVLHVEQADPRSRGDVAPIEAWTGTPRGHGERLDLDWAIYVLRGGRAA
jgi:hypothetical protein